MTELQQPLPDESMKFFFCKELCICKIYKKVGERLTQEELRTLLCNSVNKGMKQCYIAKTTGIHPRLISQFKNGKIDLYPHIFVKLENYFLNS